MIQPAARFRGPDRSQRPGRFELLDLNVRQDVRKSAAPRRSQPAAGPCGADADVADWDPLDLDLPAFTPDDPAEALTTVRMEGLVCVVSASCASLRERQMARVFAELRDLVSQHPMRTRYVLSLEAVTHAGIGIVPTLIEMDGWFRRGGRRLVLTDCPRAWRRVLRSARLDRSLPIERDLAAACRALR